MAMSNSAPIGIDIKLLEEQIVDIQLERITSTASGSATPKETLPPMISLGELTGKLQDFVVPEEGPEVGVDAKTSARTDAETHAENDPGTPLQQTGPQPEPASSLEPGPETADIINKPIDPDAEVTGPSYRKLFSLKPRPLPILPPPRSRSGSVSDSSIPNVEDNHNHIDRALQNIKKLEHFKCIFTLCAEIRNGAEAIYALWTPNLRSLCNSVIVKSVALRSVPTKNAFHWPHEEYVLKPLGEYRHSHIVEHFTFYEFGDVSRDWLVFGYCNMGDAHMFMQQFHLCQQKVPEVHVWNLVTQVASALAFLHEGFGSRMYGIRWDPIIHRDVKDSNILLQHMPGSRLPHARLTNFGFAAVVTDPRFFDYAVAPGRHPWWHPPECAIASEAGDMWASGVLIHALCLDETPMDAKCADTRENPLSFESVSRLAHSIIPINLPPDQRKRQQSQGKAQEDWVGPYSDVLNLWMHRFLDFDPVKRITAVEAVESMGKDFAMYRTRTDADSFDTFIRSVDTSSIAVPVRKQKVTTTTSTRGAAVRNRHRNPRIRAERLGSWALSRILSADRQYDCIVSLTDAFAQDRMFTMEQIARSAHWTGRILVG